MAELTATTEGCKRMYCVECGVKNPKDAKFCKQCGRRMEPPDAPNEAPQPEAVLAPHDPEARYKELLALAFRHYDLGEHEASMVACKGALALKPDSTDAHALLSTLYERLGDKDQAIAERERVLELNPASIADREKLEALRSGITQVAPRRILSARPRTPTFWDTPGGAAVIALGVTLIVVVIGYAVMVQREGAQQRERDQATAQRNLASSGAQANPTPAMPPAFTGAAPGAGSQTPAGSTQTPVASTSNQAAAVAPSMQGVPPLTVNPQAPALERDPRSEPQPAGGAFFDPARNPPAGGNPGGAPDPPKPPAPNPGRIEIVVSPGGAGTANPPGRNTTSGSSLSMESRNQAAIAGDLQLSGDYRRAAAAWVRALDGAGDDAPRIHQKAAMCFQNIKDYESARRHYADAIEGYRAQIDAGRNVEAATQGVRACEAGLKLCQ